MPFDPSRPFTTEQARRAGLTKAQLAGPAYRTVLRSVHISARTPYAAWHRVAAALMVHPAGAVATHSSAARMMGVPVPPDPYEHVTVTRAEDRRPHHGLRCHATAMAAAEIQVVRGLRISSPERLFVELARTLALVDAVVAGDWLARNGYLTVRGLRDHCAQASGRVRRAASYVRERVDSPMETRLRMLLVLAGLPEPLINQEWRTVDGRLVLRLDLSYPGVRLAIEYDGRHHVEIKQQWERDLERRGALEDDGWRQIIVTSSGIYREPGQTLARVHAALSERGWPGLRPLRDDWRPHFTS